MDELSLNPELPSGWDVADALAEGMTVKQAEELLNNDANWKRVDAETRAQADERKTTGEPTQRDKLIAIGTEAKLFRDEDHHAYATVQVDNHHENYRLSSRFFRLWLLREYGRRYPVSMRDGAQRPGAPGSQAVTEALTALEAIALDGDAFETSVRVATAGEKVYVDLGQDDWRAVEIDEGGWRLVSDPPVKFLRPRGLRPLSTPRKGGRIDVLRDFVNVGGQEEYMLVVGWLVAALSPGGPYPVLVVNGEQGSAKTTLCRVLRRLIDPNHAEVRSAPRDERDLFIACKNSHLIVFDNLSHVTAELADAICRVATGAGFATRTLFTDTDETIIQACRPQIINGIPDLATRSDLADRAIVLSLPTISDEDRRTEQEFWEHFDRQAPGMLGALLDGVSCALRRRREVCLRSTPRMADFARFVAAAVPAFGWEQGEFLSAYEKNRANAVSATLEADVVAEAVLQLVKLVGRWEGTPSELLVVLEAQVPELTRRRRAWPKSASVLSGRLKRAAPSLRFEGVDVLSGRTAPRRVIRIQKTPQTPSPSSSPAPDQATASKTKPDDCGGGVTADDGMDECAVMAKSLKKRPDDAGDANDGGLQQESEWEVTL